MRNRVTILTAALMLASAAAMAQQTAATPSTDERVSPIGTIDFGYRGTTTDGDAARYQRYRDLRNGVYTDIKIAEDSDSAKVDFRAWNIGYKDQSYYFAFNGGKARFGAFWDSIPLNYSYMTKTPFVETSPGVLTIDSATRTLYQNNRSNPSIVGVPLNCAQARTTPCILAPIPANAVYLYENLAHGFDLVTKKFARLIDTL